MKLLRIFTIYCILFMLAYGNEYSKEINRPDENGNTPLSLAIENEDRKEILNLLNKKINPNTYINENKETLLMWATRNNDLGLVEILLEKGANPNLLDGDGENILSYVSDKMPILKSLLSGGLKPDLTDDNGRTPLIIGIINNDISVIKEAIIKKGTKIINGNDPMDFAFNYGNQEAIRFLLENDFNRNSILYYEGGDDYYETPILQMAIFRNYDEIVKLLVEKGATVDGKVGDTTLEYTYDLIIEEKYEMLGYLLDKGLDVNKARTELENESILTYGIKANNEKLINLAISKKADILQKVKDIRPIDIFLKEGKLDLIKLSLESGMDINAVIDIEQNTLLTWAVRNNDLEFVKYLLGKGSDSNKVSKDGVTALMIAAENGNVAIIKELIAAKADINAVDNFGKKTIDYSKTPEIREFFSPSNSKNTIIAIMAIVIIMVIIIGIFNFKKRKLKIFQLLKEKNYEKVKEQINKGIDLSIKDSKGKALAFYIIDSNQLDLLDLVIKKGINLNIVDEKGESLLNYAIITDKDLMAKELINAGSNLKYKNIKEYDALAMAILQENTSLADEIIKSGSNLYERYGNGKTLLHIACENNKILSVKYLIEKEFDLNVNDHSGKTALHYSLSNEMKNIMETAGAGY